MHYYEVAPTRVIRAGSEWFTYASEEALPPGCIVEIPVGARTAVGVILRAVKKPSFETKPIIRTVESTPLPPALLATAQWTATYYHTTLAAVFSTVLPRGITKTRRAKKITTPLTSRPAANHQPTIEQQRVIDTIINRDDTTQILHGATGSGKTLVYRHCADYYFSRGQSSIILLPEIALTPQLVDEFTHFFGGDVLVVHSKQTEAERHRIWRDTLLSTTPKIIIGPRSALFTPLAHIGLIIIDEFHEPTYKQEQSPRYSAIRLATILAKHHRGKVILGSATPSISEYYLASQGNAPIHHLPDRATPNAVAPLITTVDMTKRTHFVRHRFLSNELLASIDASLRQQRQVLLFHNRRGTTSVTLCKKCGWTAVDPTNELPLTLHADKHLLISHVSDYTTPIPTSCPECGEVEIIHKGIGTKLLESELRKLYPNNTIVRFDGDTADADNLHNRYHDLYAGAIDIIIGTQVVAKGLDLPHLRTVGVVQADTGLSLPDFSADERTFQLLSQVIGRVGRNQLETEAIIQTYQPSHMAIRYGIAQDYTAFYEHSLSNRKTHLFPPFVYLLKLTCIYKTESVAIRHTRQLLRQLRANHPGLSFSGPAPAFYEKQHGTYRWQIIVKSKTRQQLIAILNDIPPTHWQYELDPVNLL